MTKDRTKLVMHYSPGILALLKRYDCPGQNLGPHGGHGHSSCGCNHQHQIFTVAAVHLLQPGEETWCLQQNLLPQKVDA